MFLHFIFIITIFPNLFESTFCNFVALKTMIQIHIICIITHVKCLLYFNNSMELKNRETYWETRYEDLEKQNDDLVNYIAGFPKHLEVSVIILWCVRFTAIKGS